MGLGGLRAKMRAWDRFCEGIGLVPQEVARGFGYEADGEGIEAMVLRTMQDTLEGWEFSEGMTDQLAGMEDGYFRHLTEVWERANRVNPRLS
jgi:hypothetical protein